MRLDLQRLDERIQKLQEIRRIASDPETAAILTEFITADDNRTDKPAVANGAAAQPHLKEPGDLVNQMVRGLDSEPPSNPLWNRKRG